MTKPFSWAWHSKFGRELVWLCGEANIFWYDNLLLIKLSRLAE